MIAQIWKSDVTHYVRMWIGTYHGNAMIRPHPVKCQVMTIFHEYELSEFIGKNDFPEIREQFPAPLRDYTEITRVHIHFNFIDEAFNRIIQDIRENLGGDDDTYDYWPDELDAALQIAIDFDLATNTIKYTGALKKRLSTIPEANDDDIWEWPKQLPEPQKLQYHASKGVGYAERWEVIR